MQTYDPLKARQWFALRAPINWGISIVAFVPTVFILQNIFPFLVADAIAIAGVFSLYFFYLQKRAIAIVCPSCKQTVETNTPWICGVCGTKNLNVDYYPFVNRCQNPQCHIEPKVYKCHHRGCGQPIFLSTDKSGLNPAHSYDASVVNRPAPAPQIKPKQKSKAEVLKETIVLTSLEVEQAKLDAELKEIKTRNEPIKIKTVGERLRSKVKSRGELDIEVRRLKAEADKQFAGNEIERIKRHAEIDAEAREFI